MNQFNKFSKRLHTLCIYIKKLTICCLTFNTSYFSLYKVQCIMDNSVRRYVVNSCCLVTRITKTMNICPT